MEVVPIKTGQVFYKKCAKINDRILIGIDRGGTLTKVVFLNLANKHQILDDSQPFVTFQWNIYRNDQFEASLKSILKIAYIPDNKKLTIHLTGVGSYFKCELLESIFGRKVEIIAEDLSIAAGIIIGLSDLDIKSITKSVIQPLSEHERMNNPFNKFYSSQNSRLKIQEGTNSDSPFPCLILNYGSGSAFIYVDKDGKSELFGLFFNGGKTILGLAKCLLNINSYEELIKLAASGRRENVDLQFKDIIGDKIPGLPQWFFDVTFISFGKLDEKYFEKDNWKREDIALSLVALICSEIIHNCARTATIKGISKVYLNGNVFMSPIFTEELRKMMSIFPLQLEMIILDYGFGGALAAMLCDAHDRSQYMKQ